MPDTIRIRGQPLELGRKYTMATKAYVARGRDGYDCLKECELLNDPDSGPLLSTVVRNHILNVHHLEVLEKAKDCRVSNGNLLVLLAFLMYFQYA